MANDVSEKAFSNLDTAGQIDNTDIIAVSKESGGSWISAKATISALALKIATAFNFTSDLQTTAKTLTGAINEAASSGGGTTVVANPSGTATDDLTKVQIGSTIYDIPGGGSSYTDVTGTLNAGSTSITLSNAAITTFSTIEVFNDLDVPYNSKTLSTGSITLTFDAQQSNMSVKVRVS